MSEDGLEVVTHEVGRIGRRREIVERIRRHIDTLHVGLFNPVTVRALIGAPSAALMGLRLTDMRSTSCSADPLVLPRPSPRVGRTELGL